VEIDPSSITSPSFVKVCKGTDVGIYQQVEDYPTLAIWGKGMVPFLVLCDKENS
jgi:hypothetical protein